MYVGLYYHTSWVYVLYTQYTLCNISVHWSPLTHVYNLASVVGEYVKIHRNFSTIRGFTRTEAASGELSCVMCVLVVSNRV